jgi:RNA polymerase sigma factor (TIGR02999 family)
MGTLPNSSVTVLLQALARGEPNAAAELLPLVYAELRRLADSWMAKTPPGQTLQPTALVHEAYLRLVGGVELSWENRGHFFFAAARAMRDILVERARQKAAVRHGGGARRLDLDQLELAIDTPPDELLALEEALARLERDDARKHRIVMLRFYAGLTMEEIAQVLCSSRPTVDREWRYIRARLHRELAGHGAEPPEGVGHGLSEP